MTHTDAKARSYAVRIGDRGRLVLPAELRRAAGLAEGDVLTAVLDHEGVRLRSRAQAARAGRGVFAHLAPERDLVEELIAERRADGRDESQVGRGRRR